MTKLLLIIVAVGVTGTAGAILKLALRSALSAIPALNAFALMVVVVLSARGALYTGELAVTAVLFNVYRIVAPLVVLARLAVTVPECVPPFGLIVGVATGSNMLKVALRSALSSIPVLKAFTLTVVLAVIVRGLL